MNDNNSNTPKHSTLEDILRELEERFGVNEPDNTNSPTPQKKSKGINFKRFGQNQIIGGLTLVLLVVGSAVGMFLGQQGQDVRQQASVAYPKCTNTSGVCSGGVDAGSGCIIDGAPGVCTNTESSGTCICQKNVPTPTASPIPACLCGTGSDGQCVGKNVNDACTSGGQAFYCSTGANPLPDPTGGYYCTCIQNPSPICPGGGGGATNTPTRPPNTGVPTNTPVNPTSVPPTSTPLNPTSVPPTATLPPGVTPTATRTPTRSPTPTATTTPPGPTCNSIVMSYAGTEQRPPRVGDSVTFTCGTTTIPGVLYQFRILRRINSVMTPITIPNFSNITSSRVSIPFTIDQSGDYGAQCRLCTGTAENTCQLWEQI